LSVILNMQAASTSFINESFLTLQSGQALCFVILKKLYRFSSLPPGDFRQL